MKRPVLDPSLDPSRAADRAADPAGWRLPDEDRAALAEIIAGRRDIRKFRPDPVPDDVLRRLLEAAHRAPSVGLSQPWRFIVVRSTDTRARVRALAERERLRQAPKFSAKARAFLDQKVEGVLEAPVGIAVCCVPPPPGREVLGRGTIPATDVHSTACAIQNLWLTARAEGLGVGWVSFYRPDDLREVLGIPGEVDPLAWLCVGWPDERPTRPQLERAGWSARVDVDAVVMQERWEGAAESFAVEAGPDAAARVAVRDEADRHLRPAGSLGALEEATERWAAATGAPPPDPLRAAHVLFVADHGHGSSLYGGTVTRDLAAEAAAGRTAIGVLAAGRGEPLQVVDVGLRGAPVAGCVAARVDDGTADVTVAPAMSVAQRDAAMAAGAAAVRDLDADVLVLGEIGMGNTATSAALLAALTGASAEEVVGRGAGLDAQGVARRRDLVRRALERHAAEPGQDPMASLGGLELAAITGAVLAAHDRRLPVLLDGLPVGVAALVAVRTRPTVREWLFAGHRSAEPAHGLVLAELGLEPLLDLRLRLGEGSGAALALPLLEAAGRLQRGLGTFTEPTG